MGCACDNKNCSCSDILPTLLATTYTLLLKTQNVHWNICGCGFFTIHKLTEDHYNDLFEAIDEIAERIRKIGGIAPATYSEYQKLSAISDELKAKSGCEMVGELCEDHKKIVEGLKHAIESMSDSRDFGTVDLLTARLSYHEKIVWMLSSYLEKCDKESK